MSRAACYSSQYHWASFNPLPISQLLLKLFHFLYLLIPLPVPTDSTFSSPTLTGIPCLSGFHPTVLRKPSNHTGASPQHMTSLVTVKCFLLQLPELCAVLLFILHWFSLSLSLAGSSSLLTSENQRSWTAPQISPFGYQRSLLEFIQPCGLKYSLCPGCSQVAP